MPITNIYRERRPFINFDYFDIITGRGYQIFFGISAAGITGVLNNKIYSGMIHKNGVKVTLAVQGTRYELYDFDFDIVFGTPRTIDGEIFIQIPFGIHMTTGDAGKTFEFSIDVEAFHVSTVPVETSLGTATSELIRISGLGNGGFGDHMTMVRIDVAKKHFKKDETLRFTMKGQVKPIDSTNHVAVGGVGCDPQNRSDFKIELNADDDSELQVITTDDPTRMEFHVPFVIDI